MSGINKRGPLQRGPLHRISNNLDKTTQRNTLYNKTELNHDSLRNENPKNACGKKVKFKEYETDLNMRPPIQRTISAEQMQKISREAQERLRVSIQEDPSRKYRRSNLIFTPAGHPINQSGSPKPEIGTLNKNNQNNSLNTPSQEEFDIWKTITDVSRFLGIKIDP